MIINRYISKSILKYVVLVVLIVLSLFTIIDYLSRIGKFIKQGMALSDGFGFVLLKAPYIFSMVLPVGCVLAPIVAIGLMKRNNELVALQSGGLSVYSLIKPIVFCGVVLGTLLFLTGNVIVPPTITKAYEIQRVLRNKTVKTTSDNNIWLKENGSILYINYYNAIAQTLSGLTLYQFDDNFNLSRRIDAKEAVFDQEGSWTLSQAFEIRKNNQGHGYDSTLYPTLTINLSMRPDDLKRVIKYSEEMTFKELFRYVKKVESEGYDAGYYKSDMYGKTAWPFTCLFMTLIGAGIVLARQKKDAIATNIALGTGIAFLFWFFNSFCMSLGYAGLIPAVLAAWLANLLLLCATGIILINAE